MPTFTLSSIKHPFLTADEDGPFYLGEILLPGWEELSVTVFAYVGNFRKSIISNALATRFGVDVSSGSCIAEIVVQTWFEGDVVIHRSKRFSLTFSQAKADLGEAYIHLSRTGLESFFHTLDYDVARSQGYELWFLVLRPIDQADDWCVEIPIDRLGK